MATPAFVGRGAAAARESVAVAAAAASVAPTARPSGLHACSSGAQPSHTPLGPAQEAGLRTCSGALASRQI